MGDYRIKGNAQLLGERMNCDPFVLELLERDIVTTPEFTELTAVQQERGVHAANRQLVRQLLQKTSHQIDSFIDILSHHQPDIAVQLIQSSANLAVVTSKQDQTKPDVLPQPEHLPGPKQDPWNLVVNPYYDRLVNELDPDKFSSKLVQKGLLTMNQQRRFYHRRQRDDSEKTMEWLFVEVLMLKAAGTLEKFIDVLCECDDSGVEEWGRTLRMKYEAVQKF